MPSALKINRTKDKGGWAWDVWTENGKCVASGWHPGRLRSRWQARRAAARVFHAR